MATVADGSHPPIPQRVEKDQLPDASFLLGKDQRTYDDIGPSTLGNDSIAVCFLPDAGTLLFCTRMACVQGHITSPFYSDDDYFGDTWGIRERLFFAPRGVFSSECKRTDEVRHAITHRAAQWVAEGLERSTDSVFIAYRNDNSKNHWNLSGTGWHLPMTGFKELFRDLLPEESERRRQIMLRNLLVLAYAAVIKHELHLEQPRLDHIRIVPFLETLPDDSVAQAAYGFRGCPLPPLPTEDLSQPLPEHFTHEYLDVPVSSVHWNSVMSLVEEDDSRRTALIALRHCVFETPANEQAPSKATIGSAIRRLEDSLGRLSNDKQVELVENRVVVAARVTAAAAGVITGSVLAPVSFARALHAIFDRLLLFQSPNEQAIHRLSTATSYLNRIARR